MPKLWQDTVEAHRDAVREALLDAAGALVATGGLAGISMAAIAEHAGVGRATLYRYFADLPAILDAWHARHLGEHLAALVAARDAQTDARGRLVSLLEAYVRVARQSHRHGGEMAAALHRRPHVAAAERQLHEIFNQALSEPIQRGMVRNDIPKAELIAFILASLDGAAALGPTAAARRVAMTIDALMPQGTRR